MKDEFIAVEDARAASQVGLFGALMEMTQIPGLGFHEAEQLLVGLPFRLEFRNQGVAANHGLGIRPGADQLIPATRTKRFRA